MKLCNWNKSSNFGKILIWFIFSDPIQPHTFSTSSYPYCPFGFKSHKILGPVNIIPKLKNQKLDVLACIL